MYLDIVFINNFYFSNCVNCRRSDVLSVRELSGSKGSYLILGEVICEVNISFNRIAWIEKHSFVASYSLLLKSFHANVSIRDINQFSSNNVIGIYLVVWSQHNYSVFDLMVMNIFIFADVVKEAIVVSVWNNCYDKLLARFEVSNSWIAQPIVDSIGFSTLVLEEWDYSGMVVLDAWINVEEYEVLLSWKPCRVLDSIVTVKSCEVPSTSDVDIGNYMNREGFKLHDIGIFLIKENQMLCYILTNSRVDCTLNYFLFAMVLVKG